MSGGIRRKISDQRTFADSSISDQRSSALVITESRLGRGRNASHRRLWSDDGEFIVVSTRFTHSPFPGPIRKMEFVMADFRGLINKEGEALWRLHRKEPGWVVGEQRQVFRRSSENRPPLPPTDS
ncbi:hypothetical protein KFK09_017160 [Dendrobium nobile]|uniref:Uncharacterized protein n=1 Tax=Dendrobium nobile TaxID=94219 RepID=A0A8T3B0A3_DENNO|nr:hypothetical protein KFK09_017160 [Dendrobium nobile]